jgi:DNA-binding transcriptional ArsR family regulator
MDGDTVYHSEAVVQARQAVPGEETVARLAEFFSAFADPGRVRIVIALRAAGELCVRDLAAVVGSSESAISHQLKILRLMRLIAARNDGRLVYYRLDDDHIHDILNAGAKHIGEQDFA